MTPDATATVPVLSPSGDIDLASSRGLSSRLSELAGSPGDAVLDLTDVSFMDSSALGVVLKGAQRFSRQGKLLVLVVPPQGPIGRLFAFAGVGDRHAVCATRDEALQRIESRR